MYQARDKKGRFVSREKSRKQFVGVFKGYTLTEIAGVLYENQMLKEKLNNITELLEIYNIENLCELKELLQGCYIIRRAKERSKVGK